MVDTFLSSSSACLFVPYQTLYILSKGNVVIVTYCCFQIGCQNNSKVCLEGLFLHT